MAGARASGRCNDQMEAFADAAGWRSLRIQLVLFAVVLPIMVTIVNQAAQMLGRSGQWETHVLLPIYGLYILEVAIVGYAIGIGMGASLLKWLVYAWGIALIDLQMFIAVAELHSLGYRDYQERQVPYALFAGQVGMFTIWGVLGATPLKRRLPIVATALLLTIWLGFAGYNLSDESRLFLFAQSLATVLLCGLIWAFGFRIERTDAGQVRGVQPGERWQLTVRRNIGQGASAILDNTLPQGSRLQFSLWHVFLWISSLAPVFAIARLLDWAFVGGAMELFELVSIAVGLAIAALVAMWSALGKESFWFRIVMLLLLAPLIGSVFGTLRGSVMWTRTYAGYQGSWRFVFDESLEHGIFWITWTMLSSLFLSALLAVFRASGYGLFRRTSVPK